MLDPLKVETFMFEREGVFKEITFDGPLWLKFGWEVFVKTILGQKDWRKGDFDGDNLGELKEQKENKTHLKWSDRGREETGQEGKQGPDHVDLETVLR